jgi:hypothetical protein
MNSLDELLGFEEPHATFHDAVVVRMRCDTANRRASVRLIFSSATQTPRLQMRENAVVAGCWSYAG